MSAAFNRSSRTRVPYRRSWKPGMAELEALIVDAWYSLGDAVKAGDKTRVGIFTTRLHDLGVIRFKALQRGGSPA